MARKIDWSKGKELLFNHGEKIALGTCAGLALLLGLWGLINATGAGRVEGGKSIPEAFKSQATRIKEGMDRAPEPTFDTKIFDRGQYVWGPYTSKHVPSPYSEFGESGSDKRGKPRVLPIRSDPKKPDDAIRLHYIAGLTYAHDFGLDARNKQVIRGLVSADAVGVAPVQPPPKKPKEVVAAPAEPLPALVHVGVPTRMVIVHAQFPMKQQVEEFRKALRMLDQGDMFVKNRADLPQPLGIDVLKFEVSPKGEIAKPEVLLGFDKNENTFHMNPRLEEVLRQSIYDERVPEAFKSYLWGGLCTPVPKLGNRPYPKFTFPGFDDIDWDALGEPEKKEGLMAGGGGIVPPKKEGSEIKLPGLGKEKPPMVQPPEPGKELAAEQKVKEILASEAARIDPNLVSRLFPGKEKRIDVDMNVYHVLGKKPVDRNAAANPGVPVNPAEGDRYYSAWDIDPPKAAEPGAVQPVGEGKLPIKPKGVAEVPGSVAYPPWERDALVRFIDVDVKPGYSYFYAVRVRLANPNFGKEVKDVQFARLATSPELDPSDWVETPRISIPEEYHLYTVDQKLIDDSAEGKIFKGPPPLYKPDVVARETTFQIHQWLPSGSDLLVAVADPYVIGDWVICERQTVRKGEYIGKGNVLLTPAWSKLKDTFEVPLNKDPDPKVKLGPRGLHLDLLMEYRTPVKDGDDVKWKIERKAPVLVDFTGGKRLNRSNQLEDETAVDALVLMPDGKLKVLNSHEATEAKERQERVLQNRARIAEIMRGGGGGRPAMPKEGPKLPGPGPKRPAGG